MSSAVSEVLKMIEDAIKTATPMIYPSRNFYDLTKNDGIKNAYIYAIRPTGASSVKGVTRFITVEHDFEIELVKEFIEKGSTDQSIRDAIESIYSDAELIMREISYRRSGNILVVGEPSFSEPQINQNQKSVSIIFKYPITYRKGVK